MEAPDDNSTRFTVKAIYFNEIRKFTFANGHFPTYDEVFDQLHKIFPRSHSLYLFRLLFSPNTSDATPPTIISKEVHSAEEYNACAAPYLGEKKQWPGAVLRFTVLDETPFKSRNMLSTPRFLRSAQFTSAGSCTSSTAPAGVSSIDSTAGTRIRGRRHVLLDPIRQSTTRRASLPPHTLPPTPPASSRPTSIAESTSRLTSLWSEPAGWWPLPPRPPSRGESAISTTSARTIRPSVFDLLAHSSPSTRAESDQTQPLIPRLSDSEIGRPVDLNTPRDSSWTSVKSISESIVPYERLHTRNLPSLDELSQTLGSTFVAPPPPILFPPFPVSSNHLRAGHRPAQVDDVVMYSPSSRTALSPLSSNDSLDSISQSYPRQTQPAQFRPSHSSQEHRPFRARKSNIYSPSPKPSYCCSVSEGKAEVKALTAQFTRDFEHTMIKTFGEDWDKASLEDAQPRTPQTPPPHPPMLHKGRPNNLNWIVPPPPLPLFNHQPSVVPPPPPPPCVIPPPTCLPPPSLPSIVPPPPPLPPMYIPSHHGPWNLAANVSPSSFRSISPPSPAIAIPPLPSRWLPAVAFNPTQRVDVPVATPVKLNEETVHENVRCDFCGKGSIKGIRYKCLQCPDYDWCNACMASPEAWKAHTATHAFFPIHRNEDFLHFCLVKDNRQRHQPVHAHITCDGCQQKNISGVRYKCLQCEDFDFCDGCVSSAQKRSEHDATHVFFSIESPGNKVAYNKARRQMQQPAVIPPPTSEVLHQRVHCDGCGQYPIVGVRHKCLDCSDFDFCTSCISAPERRSEHNVSHAFFPMSIPSDYTEYTRVHTHHRVSSSSNAQSSPNRHSDDARLVHKNIFCDACDHEIVGIRHKCLDCPDFDLCDTCISTPSICSQHYPQHQFFAIETAGEEIVHTIFSGDGEREPSRPTQPDSTRVSAPRRSMEPVAHNATCNMCDSRIRGDRFKCLNCPDYDVCQLCYKITPEQHPHHGFVKAGEPALLTVRDTSNDPVHLASCNVCGRRIVGVRYKCMDDTCPDFDMCENCEALPIPVHPINHPLLKMKTSNVVVPVVLSAKAPMSIIPPSFSSYDVGYSLHHVPEVSFPNIPTEFNPVNAPAQPPVLHLPEFIPNLEVPILPSPPANSIQWLREFRDDDEPLYIPQPLAPNQLSSALPTPLSTPPVSPRIETLPIRVESPPRLIPVRSWEQPFPDVVNSATPRVTEAPPRLVDVDEDELLDQAEEVTFVGIPTPSDVPLSSSSVPRLAPVNNEWRELLPELTTMFKHLFQPVTPQGDSPSVVGNPFTMPGAMSAEEPKYIQDPYTVAIPDVRELSSAAQESPLVGEPLLCRPLMPERLNVNRSLNDLLGNAPAAPIRIPKSSVGVSPQPSRSPSPSPTPPVMPTTSCSSVVRPSPLLSAAFISDNNIPVGQIFPPGAEFVKSWRMRNDGTTAWPETTELVFVAGDRMAPSDRASANVKVGVVVIGEEVELVSAEMKAPEVPDKYVSSWRLSDGKGNLFGQSVWVDITVAEMNEVSSDESLAASSVIMPMPHIASELLPAAMGHRGSISYLSIPSAPPSEGGSSISLLDVPSSSFSDDDDDDDDDAAIYEDSRSHVNASPAISAQDAEYVMLFDSSSSEDD